MLMAAGMTSAITNPLEEEIKKADDKMLFNPAFGAELKAGDTVIAVGEPPYLKQLEVVLNPPQ